MEYGYYMGQRETKEKDIACVYIDIHLSWYIYICNRGELPISMEAAATIKPQHKHSTDTLLTRYDLFP